MRHKGILQPAPSHDKRGRPRHVARDFVSALLFTCLAVFFLDVSVARIGRDLHLIDPAWQWGLQMVGVVALMLTAICLASHGFFHAATVNSPSSGNHARKSSK